MSFEAIQGDALVELPKLAERGVVFDACITDPPYGISDAPFTGEPREGKRVGSSNVWHASSDWDAEINPSWCRAACDAAPVVAWFGHWRKRERVERAMRHPLRAEIVWAKDCHVGPPCPLAMRDERIWLFGKRGIEGRTFETTVWDESIIPTWEYKHHKNEKPVALMRRLIRYLTDPADTIVDPFAGSFTTGVAAIIEGRNFIGIEQSAEYCAIGEARMTRASGEWAAIPRPNRKLPTHAPLFDLAAENL